MRKIFYLGSTLIILTAGLAGCESTANNSTANTNRSSSNSSVNSAVNSLGNAANTVANTAANLANSAANTMGKMTTDKPEDFMKAAAQGGMAEVELGKLASTKGQNPEVKKFGQMMVTDHTKANTELKALAAKKTVTLPADVGSHKSTMDKLNGLTGADFDKAYVNDMVSDHETDVAEFEKQANNSTDPEVKAFAAKTLPTLKKHLEAIKALQAKMK